MEFTSSGLDKLFIRRRSDGSCSFLNCGAGVSSCSLQGVKPRACQLWPFKVLMRPEWGFADEAVFQLGDNRLFVYADPMCHGLRFGVPSLDFANFTVKEFVEIALGVRGRQLKTTSSVGLGGSGSGFFGRRVI